MIKFLRFLIVGSLSAATHYAIYYLLLKITNPNVAFAVGYFVSFFVNFFLTTSFTFRVKNSTTRFAGFAASHLINYLLQAAIFNIMLFVGMKKELIPIPVYAISVPVNYLLVKFAMQHNNYRSLRLLQYGKNKE